ncbi:ras and Rab interactor 2-like [Scleropages formosus]|uniref:Ras and Rab interactor 2-like n=1 Tax=Scleropages formosus TaxID=113540 RepID=A0A0P7Z0T7_SCLFO|nr:ras and Rab interactor 2-like [Scleropages formosus]
MELGVRCLYYMVAQQTYDGLCLTTQPFLFKAFFLEGSAISFPDLCRLVAFYCISRDVLPFHLELPEAIAKASSHVQLESISHMGIEFWSSYLNNKQPTVEQLAPPGPAPTDCSAALEAPGTSLELCLHHVHNNQEVLCFINPLFLQQQQRSRSALHKRHRFKRSLRVRVSTETSCNLSPPASPPPPMLPSSGQEDLECMKKKASTAGPPLRRTPALSPTSEEEDYLIPGPTMGDEVLGQEDEGMTDACLLLERRRAPSLSELDSSSSFSSLEEVEDHSAAKAKPHQHTSTLKKASAAFVSLFAPEKRVAQLVEELSQDRRSAFGSLVQDFLRRQEEELKSARCPASSAMLLQGLRLFLSQAKDFLLDCGELEPPIETLVPENEKDLALEKAMFGCVLKPLKAQLNQTLLALHAQDGSTQRMVDSLRAGQERTLERFGVCVGVPDAHGMERVRQKLVLMQRAYSPIDKVVLLLQVCKCVYKAMGSPAQGFGTKDFLPALSYVIVLCNIPELLLEVEYMMELLEPTWLTGEGGYYLTSVYASLCWIQSKPESGVPGNLTDKAQESLREWSQRRIQEAQNQKEAQQNQQLRGKYIAQEYRKYLSDYETMAVVSKASYFRSEHSAVRTVLWKMGDNGDALAQLCAVKFAVTDPEHYALYWSSGGEMQPVPPQAQLQDLPATSGRTPTLIFLRCDQDLSKMRKLTRGSAVDLGESVCEE